MKKRLICILMVLSVMVSFSVNVPVFAATQEVTAGFNYTSSNFSTLELTGKDGFAIDSDGNLVMTMRGDKTSGSQLSLGGSGISGENVRFKMIYTISDATATAEYYGKKSFVQGGGFFDIYKQAKNKGSLQMSTRVENAISMFVPAYETIVYYNTLIVDMNTITGEAGYSLWQCTSLDQAKGKTSLSDTTRRIANGSGTSASGAGSVLGDFILNTSPITAGTSADITLYEFSLQKYEIKEVAAEFSYNSANFNTLNLYNKEGFSLDADGNLVMSMQPTTDKGSKLSLGGADVSGENVRFKIIYRNSDSTANAQYYGAKSFLTGGGFFDIYKQGGYKGSLQMSSRVINAGDMFSANYQSTLFYNTLIVDMNTITGEASYALWQCISLEQAQSKTYTTGLDTERQKAYGKGTSASGAGKSLGEFILNTSPITAGTSTEITIYEISLEKKDVAKKEFSYDSNSFKGIDLSGKDSFSIDSNGNLVMAMQAETNLGDQLTLGGKGLSGENIRFKIIYTNSDATATAQYYQANSFLHGGGFFDVYKQGGYKGSLQMGERVINAGNMFSSNYQTTTYYNTLIVDMNTITGDASYSLWQCTSLMQAQSKDDMSDTLRQLYAGASTAMTGSEEELENFVLNTMPNTAGTSTNITIYEISLFDNTGDVNFDDVIISEEADGSVKAFVTYANTTKADYNYSLIIASYDEYGELLDVNVNETKANAHTKLGTESVSISKSGEDAEYKAFLWIDTASAKPLKKVVEKTVSEESELIDFYYPGYTKKAVTFSYDDGVQNAAADPKIVPIFNKYGIKATFNLVGKFAPADESRYADYVNLYSGHEVANHSQDHLRIGDANQVADISAAMDDILAGRDTIERYFGQDFDSSKWGFAWAYGRPNERGAAFVAELVEEIKNEGAVYIRSSSSAGNFNLPDDWTNWESTSKDDHMEKYTHAFLNDVSDDLRLLYLWGHSSDLNTEKYGASYDDLEKILAILTNDDVNIWSATNMQIYDYVTAVDAIVVSEDNKTVFNPSDVDVYAVIGARQVIIPANGSYEIE